MALFVQADIERFVWRVNSQTETDNQEWCTSCGIARTCALAFGAKNPNASFRLNWQIARDLRSDKKRPLGHTA
jgi:hypothetical protein